MHPVVFTRDKGGLGEIRGVPIPPGASGEIGQKGDQVFAATDALFFYPQRYLATFEVEMSVLLAATIDVLVGLGLKIDPKPVDRGVLHHKVDFQATPGLL